MADKMNMFSNEVLATRIDNLTREFKDLKQDSKENRQENKEDHAQVLAALHNISNQIDKLKDHIVTVHKEVAINTIFRRAATVVITLGLAAIFASPHLAKLFNVW